MSINVNRRQGIPANWAGSVYPEPFIDAFSVEAMSAIRYASQRLLGAVFGQAYRASVVVDSRNASAFSQNNLRVGFNGGFI